ncbi:MAG: prepilin peptidase [Candidatus Omnitrophica bacterium]|nr:prepilin peptidase [Candidatus Omnitrophota bacterium]
MMNWTVIDTAMFILGAAIGSFLNVCIVRLPREKSVVAPRSHCVQCEKFIPWFDNIPFVSYLLLGGKCRYCRAPISFRYFFVEFLTAAAFVFIFRCFGVSPLLLPYLFMISCFIVATFVDFSHRIIPDEVSVGGMILGLLFSAVTPDMHMEASQLSGGRVFMWILGAAVVVIEFGVERFFRSEENAGDAPASWQESLSFFLLIALMFALEAGLYYAATKVFTTGDWIVPYLTSVDAALIGALVGGAIIYLMGLIGYILFRKEAMGGGDVKLLAMVGAFLGWKLAVLTFFIAPLFGAVFGLIEKMRTKDTAIPYGPFLVLGALISLFYGELLIAWILSGYGIR